MLEEFGLIMKITQENKSDMQEGMNVWERGSQGDTGYYFCENLGFH